MRNGVGDQEEMRLTPSFERRRAFVDDPPRLCSLMSAFSSSPSCIAQPQWAHAHACSVPTHWKDVSRRRTLNQ